MSMTDYTSLAYQVVERVENHRLYGRTYEVVIPFGHGQLEALLNYYGIEYEVSPMATKIVVIPGPAPAEDGESNRSETETSKPS